MMTPDEALVAYWLVVFYFLLLLAVACFFVWLLVRIGVIKVED